MLNFAFLDNLRSGRVKWQTFIPIILFITFLFWIVVFLPDQIIKDIFTFLSIPQPLRHLTWNTISYGLILAFLWLSMRFIHKKPFLTIFTVYKRFRWKNILKGVVVWFLFIGLVELICFYFMPGNYTYTFNPENFVSNLILTLTICTIIGFTEEALFRGYLLQTLGLLTKKPIIPLLIMSLLFGLLHYNPNSLLSSNLYHIIECGSFGLLMGVITLGEGGIETAIGIHTINNLYLDMICGYPTASFDPIPIITCPDISANMLATFLLLVVLVMVLWGRPKIIRKFFKWPTT